MRTPPALAPTGPWEAAILLLERWLERGERVDALLETAGRRSSGGTARWMAAPDHAPDRSRCQHLLFGAVRHRGRLDAAIDAVAARKPRARLHALLLVAGFELLEAGGATADAGREARIVHHAVGGAKSLLSGPEARMVNAVLRRLPGSGLRGPAPAADAPVADLARYYSHPVWLVERWLAHFGAGPLRRLLQWNQTPPPVYARWRGPGAPPSWLQAASWPEFYIVPGGRWAEVGPLLEVGALYLQDPSTLLAAGLVDPLPGETVLDLCAAPGGKSLLLADQLACRAGPSGGGDTKPAGRIVAVDLPISKRVDRLKTNLAKARGVDVALVQADVRRLGAALLREHGLPDAYPAVLLDAPCSNTGVIRHRVDVKWRLRPGDIATDAAQQLGLLRAAARHVAPGGRLVYSTCSLEPEENEGVIETFLRGADGRFTLTATRHSRPWEADCDGAGAFLLRRNA